MINPLHIRKPIQFLLGLSLVLLISKPAVAQSTPPLRIEVTVVEDRDVSQARERVTRDPVVKVEDENHGPVEGAAVVFTLPISGPSGEFENGSKTLIAMTKKDGLATAHGLKTNQVEGTLQIYVNASYRGLRARTLITQTNTGGSNRAAAKKGSGKIWFIVAAVGAAAAGGAVAVAGKGSSSSGGPGAPAPPSLISITPGAGSISPPR